MSGVPDYPVGVTLDFKFSTRQFSSGAPFAWASGAVEVYEDNDITQITVGDTLSLEFDGVTGLHNIRIVATGGNGFEAGKSYSIVASAGTVDSVSVVGEVIQQFTLDRAAAAVDLANVTDGLGAIKAETALIVADTNELQTDDVPTLISTLDAVVDTVKAETALIVADTNELQTDNVPGLIATLDAVVDTVKAETALIVADTNELQTDDVPTLISTLDAVVDTVKAETALIVSDTNELQTDWADAGRLDVILDARMAEASISTTAGAVDDVTLVATTTTNSDMRGTDSAGTAANLATVDTVVDAIKVETDKLVFTSAGRVDANVEAVNDVTDAAVKLAAHALETLPVTITTAGGDATHAVLNLVDGAAASAVDDVYNGRILVFNVGTLNHQVAEITDYDGGTKSATISAVTTAPTSAHTARMV